MPPFIASQTSTLWTEFFLFNLKLLLLKLYGSLRENLKYPKFQRDLFIDPLVTEAGQERRKNKGGGGKEKKSLLD